MLARRAPAMMADSPLRLNAGTILTCLTDGNVSAVPKASEG
jgi:hypothetical protein